MGHFQTKGHFSKFRDPILKTKGTFFLSKRYHFNEKGIILRNSRRATRGKMRPLFEDKKGPILIPKKGTFFFPKSRTKVLTRLIKET